MALTFGAFRRSYTLRAPPLVGVLAAGVGAAMLLPLVYLVIRASEHGTVFETLTRASTIETLIRTCLLAAAVTAAAILISLPAAWLTTRTDLPFRGVWSVLFSLPLVFPSYVGAFVLVAALGPRGIVQNWLEPLGVDRLPEIYGFWGAWLAITLFTFPYVLIPLRAAMKGLDQSMDDAARSLGASSFGTFFRVTLPQLRPALAAGGLLVALYTLSDFGAVSILRFDSLTRVIFIQYKSAFDRSEAASLALLLAAVALAAVWIESMTRGKARYHSEAVRRTPKIVRLGGWRWPALVFCVSLVMISLVLPASVLVYWLVRGLDAGQSVSFIGSAAVNSVQVSSLAAAAAILFALPVAVFSVRYPGALSRLIERASYTGFALPGISIALALVFFGANYAPWIYQTLPLLVFAYVVRFMPQALGASRASLLQTNPKTEEAARGLGKGKLAVLRRITLPQLQPGLSTGALLVFLTAIKELPATLLLSPIGFSTLATQIWASTNEAMFARAAAPAILLVLIAAIPTTIVVLREQRAR
ncbi:MAG: iron ABC transporter permease [Chloroflexi bacterium]|nr:iron ABC transporter permease [Chloroflexota bacterium]